MKYLNMGERFGNVPNFDIHEFIKDSELFDIPNIELCYAMINEAVNTYDSLVDRIAKLEAGIVEK